MYKVLSYSRKDMGSYFCISDKIYTCTKFEVKISTLHQLNIYTCQVVHFFIELEGKMKVCTVYKCLQFPLLEDPIQELYLFSVKGWCVLQNHQVLHYRTRAGS